MLASDITKVLESYFPLDLQEPWDKCGLQIGSLQQEVDKVMIGLNADEETLNKAITENCNMLITHHPFLLEEIVNMDFDTHHGRFIKQAVQHNIVVYSLHTCLDKGQNGISMNDWLCEELSLVEVHCYDAIKVGKVAMLKESMPTSKWLQYVKERLSIPCIRSNRGVEKEIQKVAICGGSAADDIFHLAKQVDCFITGDTKHRHMKYAIDKEILLLDIGHHAEVIMERKVKELLIDLPISVVTANSDDYYIYMYKDKKS